MKIPVANYYYLLCYGWNKWEEQELVAVKAEECEKLLDLFAKVLVLGMRHLLMQGLDRVYVQRSEESGCLRGKMNVGVTLKKALLEKGRIHSEYTELSHNVLHNQIIKETLRKLIGIEQVDRSLKKELALIFRRMTDIGPIRLHNGCFRKVHLHKNNSFYGFLLNICEMLYHNLLAKEGEGDYSFHEFIEKQLGTLFEEFVYNFYRIELHQVKRDCRVVGPEVIEWDAEPLGASSKTYLPNMRTDLSIVPVDRPPLIIDTKFYQDTLQTYYRKETIRSAHLYQLFSYLTNLETKNPIYKECRGMLLYPTVNRELDEDYLIKGHRISIRTVDLLKNWRKVEERLFEIVKDV